MILAFLEASTTFQTYKGSKSFDSNAAWNFVDYMYGVDYGYEVDIKFTKDSLGMRKNQPYVEHVK